MKMLFLIFDEEGHRVCSLNSKRWKELSWQRSIAGLGSGTRITGKAGKYANAIGAWKQQVMWTLLLASRSTFEKPLVWVSVSILIRTVLRLRWFPMCFAVLCLE